MSYHKTHHNRHILLILSLVLFFGSVQPWQEWDYETQWAADSAKVDDAKDAWYNVWGKYAPDGYKNSLQAPRPRRGHSLVHIVTPEDSMYKGDTYLVMFGGRDNNAQTIHIPKTYGVETVCSWLFSFKKSKLSQTLHHAPSTYPIRNFC
jgi:hypothetical protein